jgi:cyclopropane fatty-acyl-phospholipid synthase-like methyltransferase
MPVKKEYFRIKDNCRKGLIKYLEQACSDLIVPENPAILDIGCGTGVPTCWLAENFSGSVTAIDTEQLSCAYFQEKINTLHGQHNIKILNISFFDLKVTPDSFDMILAEGFLNVVGFEKGFEKVVEFLKPGGYFIIHDEFKDHDNKIQFIRENKCQLINTLYLNETVWWNEYYQALEDSIKAIGDDELSGYFNNDKKEIDYYKIDPAQFRSIYYIVQKSKP